MTDENEALDNEIDGINDKIEYYNGIKDDFGKLNEECKNEKYEIWKKMNKKHQIVRPRARYAKE